MNQELTISLYDTIWCKRKYTHWPTSCPDWSHFSLLTTFTLKSQHQKIFIHPHGPVGCGEQMDKWETHCFPIISNQTCHTWITSVSLEQRQHRLSFLLMDTHSSFTALQWEFYQKWATLPFKSFLSLIVLL